MVTKLRNYSATAEATMTKFKLSSKAISLGGNPRKINFLAIQVTEIFDLNGKLQKGLNSYFFLSLCFCFCFFYCVFVLPEIMCFVHHITGRRYRAIKLIFCIRIEE